MHLIGKTCDAGVSPGHDLDTGGKGEYRYGAEDRTLPPRTIRRVEHSHPIRLGRDVYAARLAEEAARLARVEEYWSGNVQQGEDPQRAARGDQVEIGPAAPKQRVPSAEVAMDVQAGHLRG